jgi:hypothetical protein
MITSLFPVFFSFSRVFNLLVIIEEKEKVKEYISIHYMISPGKSQGVYYMAIIEVIG